MLATQNAMLAGSTPLSSRSPHLFHPLLSQNGIPGKLEQAYIVAVGIRTARCNTTLHHGELYSATAVAYTKKVDRTRARALYRSPCDVTLTLRPLRKSIAIANFNPILPFLKSVFTELTAMRIFLTFFQQTVHIKD